MNVNRYYYQDGMVAISLAQWGQGKDVILCFVAILASLSNSIFRLWYGASVSSCTVGGGGNADMISSQESKTSGGGEAGSE